MNDPHVVSLRYRVKTDKSVSYNKPPAVNVSGTAYDMTLNDDVLIVTMKEHHPTVGSAMARVRDHLRAWELQTALDMGRGYLEFEFEKADVIDRDPPQPGIVMGHAAVVLGRSRSAQRSSHTLRKQNIPIPRHGSVPHPWSKCFGIGIRCTSKAGIY